MNRRTTLSFPLKSFSEAHLSDIREVVTQVSLMGVPDRALFRIGPSSTGPLDPLDNNYVHVEVTWNDNEGDNNVR